VVPDVPVMVWDRSCPTRSTPLHSSASRASDRDGSLRDQITKVPQASPASELELWLRFGRQARESAEENLLRSWGSLKPGADALARVAALRQQGVSTAEMVQRAREIGDAEVVAAAVYVTACETHVMR
jgi:hypothetical protein